MTASLAKLLNIGSQHLLINHEDLIIDKSGASEKIITELLAVLKIKNGFYAFESALHVFPLGSSDAIIGLSEWNSPDLWRNNFQGLIEGGLFFAEDIFGVQFSIKSNGVYSFNPETAEYDFVASDINAWSEAILADYEYLTGYTLAHQWQEANGALAPGHRLCPKVPFSLGGAFDIENLFSMESVSLMRYMAEIAVQIKDIPNGAEITLES